MKEQTAEQTIDENLGGLELTMDDEMWKFYSDVIRQCMQSYSDQQNAELKAEIELRANHDKKTIKKLMLANEKLAALESDNAELKERVKELEAENIIIHECLTDLYNWHDNKVGDIVKECLNRINNDLAGRS